MATRDARDGVPESRDAVYTALADGRVPRVEAWLEGIRDAAPESAAPFAVAVRLLFNVDVGERKAEAMLRGVWSCRAELARGLGRDPGPAVAAAEFAERGGRGAWPVAVERATLASRRDRALSDPADAVDSRARFDEAVAREVGRARRRGGRGSFALASVVARPDDSRSVVGSGSRIGRALRGAVRRFDRVARDIEGHFSVLLPETDRAGAVAMLARVRRDLADCPVACGIAMWPEDARDPARLRALATRAADAVPGAGVRSHHAEKRGAPRLRGTGLDASVIADRVVAREVSVVDVSRTGAALAVAGRLAIGARVHVTLRSGAPPGTGERCAFARVARRWLDGGATTVAVRFDRPLPASVLAALVGRTAPEVAA